MTCETRAAARVLEQAGLDPAQAEAITENLPAGDPVIRELWAVTDAMGASCGYDVRELFQRLGARHRALERKRASSSRLPQRCGS